MAFAFWAAGKGSCHRRVIIVIDQDMYGGSAASDAKRSEGCSRLFCYGCTGHAFIPKLGNILLPPPAHLAMRRPPLQHKRDDTLGASRIVNIFRIALDQQTLFRHDTPGNTGRSQSRQQATGQRQM